MTSKCRGKVWCKAGAEFGAEDKGKIILIIRVLYKVRSSRLAFQYLLVDKIWEVRCRPSRADHVWLRPAIKVNGDTYNEYVMPYVDDVNAIGHGPIKGVVAI